MIRNYSMINGFLFGNVYINQVIQKNKFNNKLFDQLDGLLNKGSWTKFNKMP